MADNRNDLLITQQLHAIAQEEIPTTMSIWNKLENDLQPDHKPKRKRETIQRQRMLIIALGAVMLIALAVVAFYLTPSTVQTATWDDFALQDDSLADRATALGLTQTRDGVTVTVEWAYADANRITLQYAIEHPADVSVGMATTQLETRDGTILTPGFGGVGGGGGGGDLGIVRRTSLNNYAAQPITSSADTIALVFTVLMGDELDNTMAAPSTGGGGGGGNAPQQATGEPIDIPEREFVFEFNLPFSSLLDATVEQPTQTTEEITMTLYDLRVSPTTTTFTLCYSPQELTWYPMVVIEMGEAIAPGHSSAPPELVNDETCAQIHAFINVPDDASQLTINVEAMARLQLPTPELAAEYEALFAEMGIEVDIDVDDFGGYGFRIVSLPDDRPELSETPQLVERLLFQETRGGPWVFDITLEE